LATYMRASAKRITNSRNLNLNRLPLSGHGSHLHNVRVPSYCLGIKSSYISLKGLKEFLIIQM
ncbi:hypothetical protein FGG08_006181, partial [Glutinoglossum americanum]